jgi:hypothetical protein
MINAKKASKYHQRLLKTAQRILSPVSISPTIYQQLLHQNRFTEKLQTQIVSTEKQHKKKLLYGKAAHKILVKLTPDQLLNKGPKRPVKAVGIA